jgi:hypothetical protein
MVDTEAVTLGPVGGYLDLQVDLEQDVPGQ